MSELETGLIDRGELNLEKPFLQFNVKKKYVWEELLALLNTRHH